MPGKPTRSAAAVLAVVLLCAGDAAAQQLRAVQVFVALGQRPEEAARIEYLKANAGSRVDGAGHIEAIIPRTYFDTSVPDANPVVALIQVGPGRKVACGLPRPPSPEDLRTFREGADVAFRGKLVDGHDWGEWQTLYLGDCSVHPR